MERYIDYVFSLWDTNKEEINEFIEQANRHHPTIKFTGEINDEEIRFLDTSDSCVHKGEIFERENDSPPPPPPPPVLEIVKIFWQNAHDSGNSSWEKTKKKLETPQKRNKTMPKNQNERRSTHGKTFVCVVALKSAVLNGSTKEGQKSHLKTFLEVFARGVPQVRPCCLPSYLHCV